MRLLLIMGSVCHSQIIMPDYAQVIIISKPEFGYYYPLLRFRNLMLKKVEKRLGANSKRGHKTGLNTYFLTTVILWTSAARNPSVSGTTLPFFQYWAIPDPPSRYPPTKTSVPEMAVDKPKALSGPLDKMTGDPFFQYFAW